MDDFLFSCDTATPLANNREAMWQETRANLQAGAFGDPSSLDTLIMFWQKMQLLHYPGAGETLRYLEDIRQRQMEEAQRQQQMAAEQQAAQQQMAQQQQMLAEQQAEQQAAAQQRAADTAERQSEEEMQMRIIEQARADAKEMAQARAGLGQTAPGA